MVLKPLAPNLSTETHETTHGRYVEGPDDAHVHLIRELLDTRSIALTSTDRPIIAAADTFPQRVEAPLLKQLREFGVVSAQLDEPLANDRFAMLGSLLGTPVPEN